MTWLPKGVRLGIRLLLLLISAAALPAQTSGGADAASRDAVARLEDALNGKRGGGEGNVPSPQVQTGRGGREPLWVNDPYTAYSRDHYIAVVGAAPSRTEAEKRALAALTAFFGQSIQADFSLATAYREAVSNGIITVTENTQVRDTVVTAASMDTLVGAEIGHVWDDAQGMIYAAAYMEKEKTAGIYTELIRANLRSMEELCSMDSAEKNTFNGYARYKLAAVLAGINAKYAQVVSQAGASTASLGLKTPNFYTLEAANIIKNLTVTVSVEGDRTNRVRDAFAAALGKEGLRTRGNNPPYTLEVRVDLSEVSFPNNSNKFCRYVVSANLVENETGAVLLPFGFSNRAGSGSGYAGAENSAVIAIERTVGETYPAAIGEYLAALLPWKR